MRLFLKRSFQFVIVLLLVASMAAYIGRHYLYAASLRDATQAAGVEMPSQLIVGRSAFDNPDGTSGNASMAIYAEIFPGDIATFIEHNKFLKPASIPSLGDYRDHDLARTQFQTLEMPVPEPLPSTEILILRGAKNSLGWTFYFQPKTGRLLGYIHKI